MEFGDCEGEQNDKKKLSEKMPGGDFWQVVV